MIWGSEPERRPGHRPAVFIDDDGQSDLYGGNGNAYVVPLNADMTSFDAARIKRITGLEGFREGLFMVKRDGAYHRFAIPGGDGTHREVPLKN